MDQQSLTKALQLTPVSAWRAYDEVGSTNDEAINWLDCGAPDFALVIADRQTKGRGRFDRRWITNPGASLAFSVIFRPTSTEIAAPGSLFAPLCALSVWQVLKDDFGLSPEIKWPNDVLLARKKCCGILVEAIWTGSDLNGIVMGIGINVTAESLPAESSSLFPATWIEKFVGTPVDRFSLLAGILQAMQKWRHLLDTPEFFSTWEENLAFRREFVQIEQMHRPPVTGKELGIDKQGNLLLLDATGATITVEVGDVHLRPSNEDA